MRVGLCRSVEFNPIGDQMDSILVGSSVPADGAVLRKVTESEVASGGRAADAAGGAHCARRERPSRRLTSRPCHAAGAAPCAPGFRLRLLPGRAAAQSAPAQRGNVMKTSFTIAVLAVAIASGSCTRTLDPPTPEEQARMTHAAIVSGANTLLMGDRLGYLAAEDAVERTNTTCRGDTCAAGFISLSGASSLGVEDSELTLLREHRGLELAREKGSGANHIYESYGGWLEHSLFGTRLTRFTDEAGPSRGASVVSSYSLGISTGVNPDAVEGSARWEGLMLGRDTRASAGRGQAVRGDADVTVDFAATGMTADVAFTGIVNIDTGDLENDMAWRGMAVEEGGFARRNAPGDTVSGRFYGPNEEEVGGVFERDGIAGAFAGRRTSAP